PRGSRERAHAVELALDAQLELAEVPDHAHDGRRREGTRGGGRVAPEDLDRVLSDLVDEGRADGDDGGRAGRWVDERRRAEDLPGPDPSEPVRRAGAALPGRQLALGAEVQARRGIALHEDGLPGG